MTANNDAPWSIGDVAARLNMEPDTIRYYERQAVLPPPHRDSAGHRRYDSAAVHLIEVLLHLRDTGMPLAQIAEFTSLVSTDPGGVMERLELLSRHRANVARRIDEWQASLGVIDQKIVDYQNRLASPS